MKGEALVLGDASALLLPGWAMRRKAQHDQDVQRQRQCRILNMCVFIVKSILDSHILPPKHRPPSHAAQPDQDDKRVLAMAAEPKKDELVAFDKGTFCLEVHKTISIDPLSLFLTSPHPSLTPSFPSHPLFLDHYPDGLNANFLESDAEGLEAKYAGAKGLFTDPETRDIARNVPEIMQALGELRGKQIVDLGAGTGLFLPPLDAAVGKEGHVYGVEISPGFVALLQKKKEQEGLGNTTVVRGSVTDTGLPSDLQADMVLLVDVYHHIEYVQTYMRKVREGMRKGAKLVLIDFHRVSDFHRGEEGGREGGKGGGLFLCIHVCVVGKASCFDLD